MGQWGGDISVITVLNFHQSQKGEVCDASPDCRGILFSSSATAPFTCIPYYVSPVIGAALTWPPRRRVTLIFSSTSTHVHSWTRISRYNNNSNHHG